MPWTRTRLEHNAYAAVKLPDTLSGVRQALQAAFGRDVRAVAPTAANVYLPSPPNAVQVNTSAGFGQIAGHNFGRIVEPQCVVNISIDLSGAE